MPIALRLRSLVRAATTKPSGASLKRSRSRLRLIDTAYHGVVCRSGIGGVLAGSSGGGVAQLKRGSIRHHAVPGAEPISEQRQGTAESQSTCICPVSASCVSPLRVGLVGHG